MAKGGDNNGHDAKPQDSTTRLPMIELEVVMKVVGDIRNKALETAPMANVAKKLGYANPTSTPFYRRVSAARLFGMLSNKSALTQDAIDYIKPHDEGTKGAVLAKAIAGIPYYRDLLNRYSGKKLNLDLVKNSIAKDCNLTDGCALVCAKAFEASLRFARMLSSDGTVQPGQPLGEPAQASPDPGEEAAAAQVSKPGDNDNQPRKDRLSPDTQQHVLYLDKEKSRSFLFIGPLEITKSEYERICRWLEYTMIIEQKKEVKEEAVG